MNELIIERILPAETFETLHGVLKTNLGNRLVGLTAGKGKVTVLLAPDTPLADQNRAEQIVLNHDANQRTADQLKAEQVKADFQEVVDTNATAMLQQIASDLSILSTADTAGLKQIIGRILQREQSIIKAFQYVSSL